MTTGARTKLKVERLCSLDTQCTPRHRLHGAVDYARVVRFTTPKDSEADLSATRATMAALHFLLAAATTGVQRQAFLEGIPLVLARVVETNLEARVYDRECSRERRGDREG